MSEPTFNFGATESSAPGFIDQADALQRLILGGDDLQDTGPTPESDPEPASAPAASEAPVQSPRLAIGRETRVRMISGALEVVLRCYVLRARVGDSVSLTMLDQWSTVRIEQGTPMRIICAEFDEMFVFSGAVFELESPRGVMLIMNMIKQNVIPEESTTKSAAAGKKPKAVKSVKEQEALKSLGQRLIRNGR